MTKEMLFLADIYTNWCKSQGLPDYMSADDLRYGRDTTDKLNFYQMNWLETFIDVWDCICLLYTSPSPRDRTRSRMPSSA